MRSGRLLPHTREPMKATYFENNQVEYTGVVGEALGKAAADAMFIAGSVVTTRNIGKQAWLVREYANGQYSRIKQLPKQNKEHIQTLLNKLYMRA